MDADDVVESFARFPNSSLELAWQRQGAMSSSLLLHGFSRCISKGLCSSITLLDLSHNSLGDDGVKLLAWLPRAASALALLRLTNNSFGPVAAELLAAVLRECSGECLCVCCYP